MKTIAVISYAMLFASLVLWAVIFVRRKRNPLPPCRVVKNAFLSLAPWIFAAICAVVPLTEPQADSVLIYAMSILLSVYSAYIAAWYIDFDESGFTLCSFGVLRHRYSYREVAKIRYAYSNNNSREKAGYKLKVHGRSIVLDFTAPNNRSFAAAVMNHNSALRKQLRPR